MKRRERSCEMLRDEFTASRQLVVYKNVKFVATFYIQNWHDLYLYIIFIILIIFILFIVFLFLVFLFISIVSLL